MMLIDSAIYFMLGWYIRNVFPGLCGVEIVCVNLSYSGCNNNDTYYNNSNDYKHTSIKRHSLRICHQYVSSHGQSAIVCEIIGKH